MTCPYASNLVAAARGVEPFIHTALRERGNEAEAVLVVYCRVCVCMHVSLHRTSDADPEMSDRRALEALYEATKTLSEDIRKKEKQNGKNEREKTCDSTDN